MRRPPTPSRRALLAALAGTTTALAGCGTDPDGATRTETDDPDPTGTVPTRSPTATGRTVTGTDAVHRPGTRVSLADGSVALTALRVRLGLVYPGQWMARFAAPAGEQFLVAAVDRDRPGGTQRPAGEAFALELDDRTETPTVPGDRYDPSFDRGGRLYFRVPRDLDVDGGRLRWTGPGGTTVRWRVPQTVRRRLRLTPSFDLARFDVGDATLRGSGYEAEADVDVTVRVGNDGERDGVFVGLLSLTASEYVDDYHPSRTVSFPVPRGETVTWHRSVSWPNPARGASSVGLRSLAGSASGRIDLPERTDAGD